MNISFHKPIKHIFLLILILSQVYTYDHWTNVTDETFNWETSSYDNVKWLLFFNKIDCVKCNEVYNLFNKVMKKFIDQKVGFVLIDSIKCPWLANRFNVTYLPKIISGRALPIRILLKKHPIITPGTAAGVKNGRTQSASEILN